MLFRSLVTPTETFTTARFGAYVWSGSSVRAELVRDEKLLRVMRVEKFRTYVFREIGRLGERLVTLRALERLVPVVHPLVYRKSPHDGKPLSASRMIAFVRLWGFGQS